MAESLRDQRHLGIGLDESRFVQFVVAERHPLASHDETVLEFARSLSCRCRVAGRGGLQKYQIDGKEEIGLAYAVLSEHWGQGFATEMAEASLRAGFQQLGFPEIACWTLPINTASQRVMEKLGFRCERDFEFAGLPHKFYRLRVADWHPIPECNPAVMTHIR